jgi:hypothetical protein
MKYLFLTVSKGFLNTTVPEKRQKELFTKGQTSMPEWGKGLHFYEAYSYTTQVLPTWWGVDINFHTEV